MNHGQDIDCVIIGVNVAKTIRACIESVQRSEYTRGDVKIFYVDGGSKDESVSIAKDCGVEVIELERQHPTPGLGRNAGWRAGSAPLVQFLDGDTTVAPDWFQIATKHLSGPVGAIFGQRRERHREATRYNTIADIEWNPRLPGEARTFGGDVLVRRSVLEQTGGYDEALVAGEDPDLSLRIRETGNQILHVQSLMTEHDIDMHSWDRWFSRNYRTGYSFAAVDDRHKGIFRDELQRITKRGGGSLLAILIGLVFALFSGWWLLLWIGAAVAILWPRIFKVDEFARAHHLPPNEAALYAWHCSFAVIPQFLGVARYWWGMRVGRPMVNRMVPVLAILVLAISLGGCYKPVRTCVTPNAIDEGDFELVEEVPDNFASVAEVEIFNGEEETDYIMGPGDIVNVNVWGRPQFTSLKLVVGPDGVISPTGLGDINVEGRTRQNVVDEIVDRVAFLYRNPIVTLSIDLYNNNKAYILGSVDRPGIVSFAGHGNLMEAIALAGGTRSQSSSSGEGQAGERGIGVTRSPRKATIVRGNNQLINIDLSDLLRRGNMGLNARVKNNDVIYVHDTEQEFVYVMGEVRFPRVYPFFADMTYLDALMQAGGPTQDADLHYTYVIRRVKEKGIAIRIDLRDLVQCSEIWRDFGLKDGDIVFVGQRGMAKFAYRMAEIRAGLDVVDVTTDILEEFGVMGAIRRALGTNDENAVFVQ